MNHDVLNPLPLTLPAGDAGAAERLTLAGAAAVPQREAEHRVTWQVGELDWEVQPLVPGPARGEVSVCSGDGEVEGGPGLLHHCAHHQVRHARLVVPSEAKVITCS